MQNVVLDMAALLSFPSVAVAQSDDVGIIHDRSLDLNSSIRPTRQCQRPISTRSIRRRTTS